MAFSDVLHFYSNPYLCIILILLLVILILLWKITYASPRLQGTFPSRKTVSAKSRIKTLPKTNVRARSLYETTLKRNISSGYKSSPYASTSIVVGSDESDKDKNGKCDSNGERNATNIHYRDVAKESLTESENEGTKDSHEEEDNTMNDVVSHLYDEQQIFKDYVDESILGKYIKKSGRLCGLMDYISFGKEEWEKKKINIAVTGNSGTGKSSLINAIMDLRPSDEGAAEVGITETTREIKPYPFPGKDNLVLWDLPGVGTHAFQKEEYISKCDISKFEVLIIVSATRFTENDIWLAREVLKRKKYVFFIRTKIDIDLDNEKNDHPHQFKERRCLQAVKDEINQNLKKVDIFSPHAKVYVVSSRQRKQYDFPEIFEKLKNILNLEGLYVMKYLKKHMKAATQIEKEKKKGQFLYEKFHSILDDISLRLIYNWGDDYTVRISRTCSKLRKTFCIDKNSLERFSRETGTTVQDLKDNHLNYFKEFKKNAEKRKNKRTDQLFIRYYSYKDTLHELCDILANDECILIDLRVNNLEKELLPM